MSLKSRLPIPQSLATECEKGARILNSFIKPGTSVDKFIPPGILDKAKGIAFLSVLKAGFIWSGRIGSGLVVARLPDGSWSAPSAIGLAGAGVGGQIGAELTDFVMVLTTDNAVKAFSHGGNVTLGANLGVAAGPFGRSAEASGAVRNLAPVLSYSRSKGLFAGVSLEGSAIIGRKDANEKLYGRKVTAEQLLRGDLPPPPEAAPLYRALALRATPLSTEFNSPASTSMYTPAAGVTPGPYGGTANYGAGATYGNTDSPGYSASNYGNTATYDTAPPYDHVSRSDSYHSQAIGDAKTPTSVQRRPPPPPPPAAKKDDEGAQRMRVVALYDFPGEQPGDLPFKHGDLIIVTKKSDNEVDWWEGTCNGKTGSFPSNYVSPA
ncbi:hypothetical protein BX070DRAFT_190173 [Coemansia spiralis]|nr:hypothetical protein BX070DRAFT_190173 [Coemansia spiralis]